MDHSFDLFRFLSAVARQAFSLIFWEKRSSSCTHVSPYQIQYSVFIFNPYRQERSNEEEEGGKERYN